MNLSEIFNSRADVDWTSGFGKFTLDNVTYGISAVKDSLGDISGLEIFFYTVDDKHRKMELTKLDQNQFKVIGIVKNAIKQKFPGEEVIWFVAKHGIDGEDITRRSHFYGMLLSRLSRELNYLQISGMFGTDHVYVLFKDHSLLSAIASKLDKVDGESEA